MIESDAGMSLVVYRAWSRLSYEPRTACTTFKRPLPRRHTTIRAAVRRQWRQGSEHAVRKRRSSRGVAQLASTVCKERLERRNFGHEQYKRRQQFRYQILSANPNIEIAFGA